MRILVVSPFPPYPPADGGKVRVFNLIRELSRRNEVTLLCFYSGNGELSALKELERYCRVEGVERRELTGLPSLLFNIRHILSPYPIISLAYRSKRMAERLNALLASGSFDVVQIELTEMGPYLPDKFAGVGALTEQDLSFVTQYRRARNAPGMVWKAFFYIQWLKSRRLEKKLSGRFDLRIMMSQADAEMLRKLCPGDRFQVVPNGATPLSPEEALAPFEPGKRLLYIGSTGHWPNRDGLLYFHEAIFPILKEICLGVKLDVAGSDPVGALKPLETDPDIKLHGFVKETGPMLKNAISIVPLRVGSGTRLKILEAMAAGSPVVSTSIGCEGIEVRNNENILIADSPREFAEACKRLMEDRSLSERIRKGGYALVSEKYSWEKIAAGLERKYMELLPEKGRAALETGRR
ncbi:MAG: glycosyltransferase [Deltaproteobacteria bacterium]|nr:glycosyltransferase [Deltaproteobacteria bacterium]MBZ0220276.1 glycosyltransferase family 4 protein [Deltaproteobacteria bacterium]